MDKFAAKRVFIRIADAGNLSAAGRQLGLSLASVSREPATPDDLVEQDCVAFGDVPGVAEWSFWDGAVRRSLRIPTRLCANDFETLVSAALAGAGLVRVPSWQVAHCLAERPALAVLQISDMAASQYSGSPKEAFSHPVKTSRELAFVQVAKVSPAWT